MDLHQLRTELRSDSRETEQRLNARIDLVRSDLSASLANLTARFDGQITLLKWMLGLCISLSTALLIRLFFFRIQ